MSFVWTIFTSRCSLGGLKVKWSTITEEPVKIVREKQLERPVQRRSLGNGWTNGEIAGQLSERERERERGRWRIETLSRINRSHDHPPPPQGTLIPPVLTKHLLTHILLYNTRCILYNLGVRGWIASTFNNKEKCMLFLGCCKKWRRKKKASLFQRPERNREKTHK